MQEKMETSTTASEVLAEEKTTAEAAEETAKTTKKAKETEKKVTTGKKRGPKPGSKREPAQIRMVVQYQNNDTEIAAIEERVKAQFVAEGHRAGAIKKLDIYIKPEEFAAYYVINEKFSGRVDLF